MPNPTTPNKGLKIPQSGNRLSDDVLALIDNVESLDGIIALLEAAIAAKMGKTGDNFTSVVSGVSPGDDASANELVTAAWVRVVVGAVVASSVASQIGPILDQKLAESAGTAPDLLNTIQELAEALNNDHDAFNTLKAMIDAKVGLVDGLISKDVIPPGVGGRSVGPRSLIRTNSRNMKGSVKLWELNMVVTADALANTISAGTDNEYEDGDIVQFETTGTLPAPLQLGVDYYVRDITATTMKLAETYGGTEIDLTDAGTGDHTLYLPVNGVMVGRVVGETGARLEGASGSRLVVI